MVSEKVLQEIEKAGLEYIVEVRALAAVEQLVDTRNVARGPVEWCFSPSLAAWALCLHG
jgi:hypothetical protein